MRLARITVTSIVCALFLISAGCVSEQQYKDLKIQNATQQKRIAELESELQTAALQLDQAKRQLDALGGKSGVEISSLQQKIAALEEEIAKKRALIEAMQKQLLGGVQLPADLHDRAAEPLCPFDLVFAFLRQPFIHFLLEQVPCQGDPERGAIGMTCRDREVDDLGLGRHGGCPGQQHGQNDRA